MPAEKLLERTTAVLGAPPATEVIEKRTPTSKTFALGGGKFHVSKRLRPIHYQNDKGKWDEVDTSVDASMRVEKTPYKLRLLATGKVGYRYTSRANGGWMEMELVSLDSQPVGNVQRRRDEDKVRWTVAPGVSMYLQALPEHPEIFKVYNAPHTTVWRITAQDFPGQFNPNTRGKDANGDSLEIVTSYVGDLFSETWTGRVSRIAERRRRQKAWFDDPSLPVLVDAAITENIVDGADDVSSVIFQYVTDPGNYFIDSFDAAGASINIDISTVTATQIIGRAGFRFRDIALPVGATINEAIFSAWCTTDTPAMDIQVFGDDVDDAPVWGVADRPRDITKTTASATIETIPGSPEVPVLNEIDVTSVVVEIHSRAGWASGNDMRFGVFTVAGTGINNFISFQALEAAGTDEAQLDITYTEGAEAESGILGLPRHGSLRNPSLLLAGRQP